MRRSARNWSGDDWFLHLFPERLAAHWLRVSGNSALEVDVKVQATAMPAFLGHQRTVQTSHYQL